MMALPQIVSRNRVQQIPEFDLNVRKVLSGGTDGDFYTVPTGKKAIIEGSAICTGLGAAATVDLEFDGTRFHRWDAASGTEVALRTTIININIPFKVQLAAGQVLRYTQDSGTNAEMNITTRIQESAA